MVGLGFIRFSKVMFKGAETAPLGVPEENAPSGSISLKSGTLEYSSVIFASWRSRISDLRLVGEYSIHGQWFLVFVVSPDCIRYRAPVYSENMRETRAALAVELSDREWELKPSEGAVGRVVWPAALRDEPMFASPEVSGFWQRAFSRRVDDWSERNLSPIVEDYLGTG